MKPLIFTIFGATGDLTFRKLVPALFTLYSKKIINKQFTIVGFARKEMNDLSFQDYLDQVVDKSKYSLEEIIYWKEFLLHIKYVSSDFHNTEGYSKLSEIIKDITTLMNVELEKDIVKVFYLSTSPESFQTIAQNISESNLCEICSESQNSRIVIEKPYGIDLQNSIDIDTILRKSFLPEHIYRIDHYLGKESVQNILVFRFANFIFERLWNKDNIDHIQIKVDENLGVEERGGYYDTTGVIKDMVQNHILQVISLITMEAPDSIMAQDIQAKRLEILKNTCLFKNEDSMVLGQYDSYKHERNVNLNSKTPTFISMKLMINNSIWEGVPIYIRTGKKMEKKTSEVFIKFKDRDINIYDKLSGTQNDVLCFRIQPDEGISIMMMTKKPSDQFNKIELAPISLDFCYRPTFNQPLLDSYVGLLQNVITADQSLFTSIEEVKAQWEFINHIYSNLSNSVILYNEGTNGPKESDDLLKKDGRDWIDNQGYTCALK